jgi:hypothetical protein
MSTSKQKKLDMSIAKKKLEITTAKKKLETTCSQKYAELFGYTVYDVRKIAKNLNIPGTCKLNKVELCTTVSKFLVVVEYEMQIEAQLKGCRETLAKFQETSYLATLGEKGAKKMLQNLIQQILWLLERHEEFGKKRKMGKLSDLRMLSATIESQCRQGNSIFKGMETEILHAKKSRTAWFN